MNLLKQYKELNLIIFKDTKTKKLLSRMGLGRKTRNGLIIFTDGPKLGLIRVPWTRTKATDVGSRSVGSILFLFLVLVLVPSPRRRRPYPPGWNPPTAVRNLVAMVSSANFSLWCSISSAFRSFRAKSGTADILRRVVLEILAENRFDCRAALAWGHDVCNGLWWQLLLFFWLLIELVDFMDICRAYGFSINR